MPKIILDFIFAFSGMFLVSYYFYSSTNWGELSKKYAVEKNYSSTFTYNTQEQVSINRIAINRLNIGISDRGLFLAFPSLLGFLFSSLLIPWSELYYGQNINADSSTIKNFIVNIGNPTISSLYLSSSTIEKIHVNYGEPIFFERLGKLDK